MLKNYLKIAFRNLARYKFISFINLFGLTVGLTCCLLILTYILHETSYDKYNSKADRIYRVTRSFNNREGVVSLHLGAVAPPFGPLLQNEFPDIQKVTRILTTNTTMRYEDKNFNEKDIFFADNNFTGVFDVAMLKGDPQTALNDPWSVMMTEAIAKKYFGNEDPINKMIQVENKFNLKVTGIFKPFPDAAHMHPSILVSFNTLKDSAMYGEQRLRTNWGNNAFFTYLLLPDHYPVNQIASRFPAFLDKYMHQPGDAGDYKYSKFTKLYLQKLTDIHLGSHLDEEIEANGDRSRVLIFGAIALFILLIACINYMNLSTARSALRAREVGIRKVAGAQRGEIMAQFLSESVLITFIAGALAFGATYASLPWLNKLTGQELSFTSILQPAIYIPMLLAPVVIGLLSGLYPAVFMSSFQPVKVLKGLFKAGNSAVSFRKVLVVTQFSISIILIICTAVVFRQLKYMQTTSLGLNKDHIVLLNHNSGLAKNYEAFRTELLQSSLIKDATRSSRVPSGRLLDSQGASSESGDSLKPVTADIKYVVTDEDFAPTYGISMAAGRYFSRAYGADSTAFVLNAAATRALGMRTPSEAVGKNFRYGAVRGKVIGVLSDFHFESLHQQIVPLLMAKPSDKNPGGYNYVSVKLSGSNTAAALAEVEKVYRRFAPESPFEYRFLDEQFAQLYATEQQQGTLFTSFSVIAIFIACLGLLGLSAFEISQRIKEIGIRKVLGASTGGIVGMLSKDFLKLVAIAAVIAFLVAGYAMNKWLGDFAYRTSIPWWIFIVAGILAAFVALVTISFQAIRAALSNPVKNLRSE